MAYNKAKEEKKWRLWKANQEKMLRQLGVDEEKILALRQYDWEVFKSDRRFMEPLTNDNSAIYLAAASEEREEVESVDKLLDLIENKQLYDVLAKQDRITLKIALLKMQGYKAREIAEQLSLSEKAVYRRMDRLKEKIIKFF